MKAACAAFVLLIRTLQCLASDDSPFQLTNKGTGFCLVKTSNQCNDIRWTTGERLLVLQRKKCLGVQGKSVGSEISLYDCDENNDLQKWECRNETLLALKDQELYVELTADNTAVLSRTTGPSNQLTISGTSSGACSRTYRELYTIGGNAAGMPCMFPFQYQDQWYSDCTTVDAEPHLWCAVETKYQNERWGYCPVTTKDGWNIHPITGAYYQLNTQAALSWPQAETSCKQQGASLLSLTDPHQHAYVTALLGTGGNKIWIGLIHDSEHGWKWSNGGPYRYMKWDSGHPLPNPGHICALVDPAVQFSWQSSTCSKKLGYICYSKPAEDVPVRAVETGFCSRPWLPYNGQCFYLNRTQTTWSDAQRDCRSGGGNLASIRNVEDQSFIITQLGYESNDELWIGLNDRQTEGLFDWADHSTVSFTSWQSGKPQVSSQVKDCVLIRGENGNWVDHVCAERHGSICMKMGASRPTGDEVEPNVGCKSGWRRHGSYCYFIGTQTKTFDDAKDNCQSSGSYLADVSNGVDNAFLVSLVGMRPAKHFWLGLSNQKQIDNFVWTNTDTVRFTHWNAQMPGHQQGCVAMKTGFFAGLWDVLPCTNTEKYICKHLAEGAAVTPAPPTDAPTSCENQWTQMGRRKTCFKLFSSSVKRTWFEARDYCKAIGGDLLSIHSASEQQLLPYRYEKVWIGLSAPDPAAGYVWSDGSALQFQHWEDGEPNNKNNVESCAELKLHQRDRSGSWNDAHCETENPWLCQIAMGVTPKDIPNVVTPDYNRTSDGWLIWRESQYYIDPRPMPMEDARRFCQVNHGDLVTINSEAESVFLWKQIYKYYGNFWIGLTVDLDKTYGWLDDSPVVFQRWDEDQPRFLNNDENCVVMTNHMGFWHDYNCGFEHRIICKRSSSPPANTTVPPTVPLKGGCPQNWKKIDTKCFNIINDRKETWKGAQKQCQSMGGNLASILSRLEHVFLTAAMLEAPTTDLWIGLHNSHGNPFYWTDGRPMRYNSWGTVLQSHDHYEDYFNDMPSLYEMDQGIYIQRIPLVLPESVCAVMSTNSEVGLGKWIKKNCNDTTGYVCLRNVDPSLPDSPEPTTYTDYVRILNDSVKVVTESLSWDAARKVCEGDGAQLASVRTDWLLIYTELIALKLKAPVWIGINKMQTSGYYRYISGWRLTLTNWASLEPDMNRPCVFVDVDGYWRTADCNENKTSICMKSAEAPPTQSSEFPGFCPEDVEKNKYDKQKYSWIPFKGYCYLIVTERVEWPGASTSCMIHGASLVSIEDPTEQEFIEASIKVYRDSQGSFWMGLYKTHKGLWQWLDKTTMDYNNWSRGQHSGFYGAMQTSDGTWSSGTKWYSKGYICKIPKVLPHATPKPENAVADPQTRGHVTLAVILVITLIAIGIVIILFIFKKSGRHFSLPEKLTTFDNPLFFNNVRSNPNVVDTSKLVANAEEEDAGSVITV